MPLSPMVTIIILNWNNASDTLACLNSVTKLDYDNFQVIVVDNDSTDDSVVTITTAYPDITMLEAGQNLGYAGGNNLGIKHALQNGCQYIWLLNDDVIVAPDALSSLMSVALAKPQAGFLGPKVYIREQPECILSAGGLLHDYWQSEHLGLGELDEGQFDTVAEVDYLSGCALLVNRKVIEAVGILDEDFFAYNEDVEWCYRGKRTGFKNIFVPEAKVWHPDTRGRDENSPAVTYYTTRNSLQFIRKHDLGFATMVRTLSGYARTLLSWSLRPRWRHKREQRNALTRAIMDFARKQFGPMG